jgi:hypothetical protein
MGSAIDTILRESGERERLRAAGNANAKRFSWAGPARRTLAVYQRILVS